MNRINNLLFEKSNNNFILFLFVLIFTISVDLIFSKYGFNPTDDGFILALSKRLVLGEVPHKDFISVRPVLSSVIHIPEVLLGGDFTFRVSRFIFLIQMSVISLLIVLLISGYRSNINTLEKIFLFIVSFTIMLHTFPIMVWHTIDGIFFSILGIYLSNSMNEKKKVAGYFVCSLAYLCKQNFVVVPFLLIIINKDYKKPKCWIAIIIPIILYSIYLLFFNAIPDFITQLFYERNFISKAFMTYLQNYTIFIFLILIISTKILFKKQFRMGNEIAYLFIILLVLLNFSFIYSDGIFNKISFIIFGILLWYTASTDNKQEAKLLIYFIVVGWAASISYGVNYPVFFLGAALALIIVSHRFKFKKSILIIFIFFNVFVFCYNRIYNIYREDPLFSLDYELYEIAGMKGIYTNEQNSKVINELNTIIRKYSNKNKKYFYLPEYPALWVNADQKNYLAADWYYGLEGGNKESLLKISETINQADTNYVLIIQKYEFSNIEERLEKISIKRYPVLELINYESFKIDSNKYFNVYLKK